MKREKLISIIEENLLSTEKVAEMLGITKTRLNKVKYINVVIRGYYLKSDVEAYLNNEELQNRRAKYKGENKQC